MVYHLSKTFFYLFFLFIGIFTPSWAQNAGFAETARLNQEMDFLKKHSKPYIFLSKELVSDSISTKQAANQKIDKKATADSILKELEEETGAFKPSPPNYTN